MRRERQRRADRVHVRVDQAGDHRAALQVDDAVLPARFAADELFDLRVRAERDDAPVADRERLMHRGSRVEGDDPSVEKDGVGGLSERGGTGENAAENQAARGKSRTAHLLATRPWFPRLLHFNGVVKT